MQTEVLTKATENLETLEKDSTMYFKSPNQINLSGKKEKEKENILYHHPAHCVMAGEQLKHSNREYEIFMIGVENTPNVNPRLPF